MAAVVGVVPRRAPECRVLIPRVLLVRESLLACPQGGILSARYAGDMNPASCTTSVWLLRRPRRILGAPTAGTRFLSRPAPDRNPLMRPAGTDSPLEPGGPPPDGPGRGGSGSQGCERGFSHPRLWGCVSRRRSPPFVAVGGLAGLANDAPSPRPTPARLDGLPPLAGESATPIMPPNGMAPGFGPVPGTLGRQAVTHTPRSSCRTAARMRVLACPTIIRGFGV